MDAAIHYGKGDLRLAVFSDPDCPYCRRLTKVLRQAEGIAVSEIMFPVPALHPEAKKKAAAQLCAEQATARPASKEKETAKECLQTAHTRISEAMKFGQQHGIYATPTLIAPDGRVHAGFMPLDEIKSWLKEDGR